MAEERLFGFLVKSQIDISPSLFKIELVILIHIDLLFCRFFCSFSCWHGKIPTSVPIHHLVHLYAIDGVYVHHMANYIMAYNQITIFNL
jgi:hypothetical protein